MARSIKKNVVAKALLTIVNIVIPVILGPYTARVLDVELYTMYNKALTLISWFLPFALFGIPTFGLREISAAKSNKTKLDKRFSQLFYFNILTSFVTAVFFFVVVVLKFNNIVYYLLLFQLITTFLSVEYVNEAFENFGFILYKNLFLRIVYIILILVFVRKSSDIVSFAIISIGFYIANNIFSYLYVRKYIHLVKCSFIEVFSQFIPLFPVLLLSNTGMLYTNLDCLFLSTVDSGYDITYYIIVRTILISIVNVFFSIIQVSIPRLSKFYADGEKSAFVALFEKSSNIFYFFGIPFCITFSVLGQEIMFLYGGGKYILAGPVMSVFAFRFILYMLISVATDAVLFTTRNEKKLTLIYFLGGLINVVANFLLVISGRLTAVSAIATTMLSEILVIILQQCVIKKIDKNLITLNKAVIKYIFVSICIVYGVVLIFPTPLSFSSIYVHFFYLLKIIVLCCACYVTILFLMKDVVLLFIFDMIKGKIKRYSK